MLHTHAFATSARSGPPPRNARTYVVLALSDGGMLDARPLGTVDAACRGAARVLARALHADVLPSCLRVMAAGSVPGDLVARALACDGHAVGAIG